MQFYFGAFETNGGQALELDRNSIVVVTGANNVGKSTFLTDINRHIDSVHRTHSLKGAILKSADLKIDGSCDDYIKYVKEKFKYLEEEEKVDFGGYANGLKISTIIGRFEKGNFHEQVISRRSLRLTAENRLGGAEYRDGLKGAVSTLFYDNSSEFSISEIFKRAFGVDLVLDRLSESSKFRIGDRSKLPKNANYFSQKTRETLDSMEDVFSQGDGMRSFARMLLEIKTGERDIILIDEPELFLHPPQLRELARLIARETAPSTQFFIATHNETFLRSLLEYSMERVVLLRLKRHATATDITHLASEQVKQLWGDANISSSGVMGALFSHTSVLCEGDNDVRFLSSMRNELDFDFRFLGDFYHCGGKHRIPIIKNSLNALGVSVAAVVDIDCLSDRGEFKSLISSFGGKIDDVSEAFQKMQIFIDNKKSEITADYFSSEIARILSGCSGNSAVPNEVRTRVSELVKKTSSWSQIKEIGINYFSGEAHEAVINIISYARERGLFILEHGELESFCKSIPRSNKAKWLSRVLCKDLSSDSELTDARKIIKDLSDFSLKESGKSA